MSIFKLLIFLGIIGMSASKCEESNSSLLKVMDLPGAVQETSGLAIVDGVFYTHNDSGDGPYIYVIDTLKRNISKRIRLKGTKNTDWEDISTSGNKIFIADTGNNTSSRKKYRLITIDKEALDTSGVSTSDFREVEFTFRNEKDKRRNVNSEAMITMGDTCYFLSKELGKTNVYRLLPETDKAVEIGKMELPFEATGWCKISETKTAICGYRKAGATLYMSDVAIIELDNGWDSTKVTSLNLKLTGQFEGIFYDKGNLYLTAEGVGINRGRLYKYPYAD